MHQPDETQHYCTINHLGRWQRPFNVLHSTLFSSDPTNEAVMEMEMCSWKRIASMAIICIRTSASEGNCSLHYSTFQCFKMHFYVSH